MTLLGMLHHRKSPHHVNKAYAYAAVAKMEGIDFVYFSYRSVDFRRKKITGWIYKAGSWVQKDVRFPDCIINISAPRTDMQSEVREKLIEHIPFVSHSIGSKMYVFEKIKQGKEFSRHLIPTLKISSAEEIYSLLSQWKQAVIKPSSGSKGRNIYFITLLNNKRVQCQYGTEKESLSEEEFNALIESLVTEQMYIIQPYIECKTKAGLAYDFRLHVQKNGEGKWVINLIYPRISGNSRLTSNISAGGYWGDFIPFLKEQFGDDYFEMKQLLEYFAISFASHFESLYEGMLFDELGIDVGVDQHKQLWLFEVNWRPGTTERDFSVAQNAIPYARYLAHQRH